MKQIKLYFGKQQDGVLGSYADVITLEQVDEEQADNLIHSLTETTKPWVGIKSAKGVKFINLNNILWFDVNDVEEGDKDGTK